MEVHPGFSPAEIDEMEIWQIAVLFDRHHLKRPMMPTRPDDWEERAKMYEKVRALRAEERAAAMAEKAKKRRR